jgi:hypothetical protein
MKPISTPVVVLFLVLSSLVGFGYSQWAVNNGLQVPISGVSLALSLLVIAAVLIAMVIPLWKYKRNLTRSKVTETRPSLVNPFFAVRVFLLAKSSAITAAMFIGWHSGVLVKQVTAPVQVANAMAINGAVLVAAVVLLVVAYVVESICKLPKDPETKDV